MSNEIKSLIPHRLDNVIFGAEVLNVYDINADQANGARKYIDVKYGDKLSQLSVRTKKPKGASVSSYITQFAQFDYAKDDDLCIQKGMKGRLLEFSFKRKISGNITFSYDGSTGKIINNDTRVWSDDYEHTRQIFSPDWHYLIIPCFIRDGGFISVNKGYDNYNTNEVTSRIRTNTSLNFDHILSMAIVRGCGDKYIWKIPVCVALNSSLTHYLIYYISSVDNIDCPSRCDLMYRTIKIKDENDFLNHVSNFIVDDAIVKVHNFAKWYRDGSFMEDMTLF